MTCNPAIAIRERADAAYETTGERLFELFYQEAKDELAKIDTVDPQQLAERLGEHHRAFVARREARKAELSAVARHGDQLPA